MSVWQIKQEKLALVECKRKNGKKLQFNVCSGIFQMRIKIDALGSLHEWLFASMRIASHAIDLHLCVGSNFKQNARFIPVFYWIKDMKSHINRLIDIDRFQNGPLFTFIMRLGERKRERKRCNTHLLCSRNWKWHVLGVSNAAFKFILRIWHELGC